MIDSVWKACLVSCISLLYYSSNFCLPLRSVRSLKKYWARCWRRAVDPSGKSGRTGLGSLPHPPRKSLYGSWDVQVVRTTSSDLAEAWDLGHINCHTHWVICELAGGAAIGYVEKMGVSQVHLRHITTRGHCGHREFTGSQHWLLKVGELSPTSSQMRDLGSRVGNCAAQTWLSCPSCECAFLKRNSKDASVCMCVCLYVHV